jgi:hypothetical protein
MPSNIFSVIILLAALAPGFVYLQAYQRRSLRDTRSATAETVEMFAFGALATLLAGLTVLVLGQLTPAFVTLDVLLKGTSGLGTIPWKVIASASLTLALSTSISGLAGTLLGNRRSSRVATVREGILAVRVLTARSPKGRRPYLAVELNDGRLVEGYLWYASTHEDPARRDIALQKPLAWSGNGQRERTKATAERVLIPGSMIRVIHLSYPAQRNSPS